MKLNEGQLYASANEFIEQVVMPLGASMSLTEQFMFGLKIGIARRKLQDVVSTYINSSGAKTLGLVDENGYIDIDTIYQSACDSMSQCGHIDVGGITFKEADLQRLYSIMQRHSN
jgi:hypothetical protein